MASPLLFRTGVTLLAILTMLPTTWTLRTRSPRALPVENMPQYVSSTASLSNTYQTHYELGNPPRYQDCCSYREEGNRTRYTLNLAGWGDEDEICGLGLQQVVRASGNGDWQVSDGWACVARTVSANKVDTYVYIDTSIQPSVMPKLIGHAQKRALSLSRVPKWQCFDQDDTQSICNGVGKCYSPDYFPLPILCLPNPPAV